MLGDGVGLLVFFCWFGSSCLGSFRGGWRMIRIFVVNCVMFCWVNILVGGLMGLCVFRRIGGSV